MLFKDKLKKIRTNNNMSQEELAKKLGYARTTISAYEVGRNEPSYEDLKKISQIFNITIDDLLDNDSDIATDNGPQIVIPEEFTNPKEARKYIGMHTIFGSGGFRPEQMDDEEILLFANEMLKQMELISYKYKK